MTNLLITTYEEMRVERSTPTTSEPVRVRFTFHVGYGVWIEVLAEVTEERDGDGNVGHDVTILAATEPHGGGILYPYEIGMEEFRSKLEKKAVEYSHNSRYHIKN